jgi:hypothetical protein
MDVRCEMLRCFLCTPEINKKKFSCQEIASKIMVVDFAVEWIYSIGTASGTQDWIICEALAGHCQFRRAMFRSLVRFVFRFRGHL